MTSKLVSIYPDPIVFREHPSTDLTVTSQSQKVLYYQCKVNNPHYVFSKYYGILKPKETVKIVLQQPKVTGQNDRILIQLVDATKKYNGNSADEELIHNDYKGNKKKMKESVKIFVSIEHEHPKELAELKDIPVIFENEEPPSRNQTKNAQIKFMKGRIHRAKNERDDLRRLCVDAQRVLDRSELRSIEMFRQMFTLQQKETLLQEKIQNLNICIDTLSERESERGRRMYSTDRQPLVEGTETDHQPGKSKFEIPMFSIAVSLISVLIIACLARVFNF
ncbi:hypothetical protein GEMRC1_006554 [Eukaryota sp. GEM-RC1]